MNTANIEKLNVISEEHKEKISKLKKEYKETKVTYHNYYREFKNIILNILAENKNREFEVVGYTGYDEDELLDYEEEKFHINLKFYYPHNFIEFSVKSNSKEEIDFTYNVETNFKNHQLEEISTFQKINNQFVQDYKFIQHNIEFIEGYYQDILKFRKQLKDIEKDIQEETAKLTIVGDEIVKEELDSEINYFSGSVNEFLDLLPESSIKDSKIHKNARSIKFAEIHKVGDIVQLNTCHFELLEDSNYRYHGENISEKKLLNLLSKAIIHNNKIIGSPFELKEIKKQSTNTVKYDDFVNFFKS